MSNNNAGNAPAEPEVTLDSVSIGMKRQKKQLLALAALCLVSVPSALLALVLMITRAEPEPLQETVTTAEMRALQSQLATLEAEYARLLEASTQSHEELAALTQKVVTLDVQDERNAVARLQQLMVRQEQDYQQFLATLEGGLYNFHMMIPHSRGWWDAYKADLMESVELSKSRELYASTLREIEPQGINQ